MTAQHEALTDRAALLDDLAAAQPGVTWEYMHRWIQWAISMSQPSMSLHEAKSLLLAALYEAQEPSPNWQAWMDQAQRYGLAPRDAIRLAFRADALSRIIFPVSVQHEVIE